MKKNVIIGVGIVILGVILLAGIFFKEIITDTSDGEGKRLTGIKSSNLGLGKLCSGEEECIVFCHNNQGR